MEKPYFVILNHQRIGIYLPMVDDNGQLAMFTTDKEAIEAGNNNPLGRACGFEVFEIGGGLF